MLLSSATLGYTRLCTVRATFSTGCCTTATRSLLMVVTQRVFRWISANVTTERARRYACAAA